MRGHGVGRIGELVESGAYGRLRLWLAAADPKALAQDWPRLEPFDKLIAFKLMDAASALDFFRRLPYEEGYFLFSAFSLQSIAPVIAEAPFSVRRLFVQLPARFYGIMLGELARSAGPRVSGSRA